MTGVEASSSLSSEALVHGSPECSGGKSWESVSARLSDLIKRGHERISVYGKLPDETLLTCSQKEQKIGLRSESHSSLGGRMLFLLLFFRWVCYEEQISLFYLLVLLGLKTHPGLPQEEESIFS